MSNKKVLIISAINFFEGGPLSIMRDCLSFLNNSQYIENFKFVALVHKKDLFIQDQLENIEFIEFPKSRISYFYRLYYEYFYFKKLAKTYKPFFWLSLHDTTPNIGGIPQAVYCHNPSPFNKLNWNDIYIQPTQFFFRLFYKYLYQINIRRNKYVIVQQLWIKERFETMFGLNSSKIIIAAPQIPTIPIDYLKIKVERKAGQKVFFFPTFPRPFKNIEVICDAVKLVLDRGHKSFKVIITIDGSENKYSKSIFEKYKHIDNIDFIGLIKREAVYIQYAQSDCLIFPSKLETWGLPISEFKQFHKTILVSDLPYAKETVNEYEFANFFDPNNPFELCELIINVLENNLVYYKTKSINYDQPYANGWGELFTILLHN